MSSSRQFIFLLFSLNFFNFQCVTTGLFGEIGPTFSMKADTHTINGQRILYNGNTYKVGESCSFNLLGIVAFGDSSIRTSIRKGEILKPIAVDQAVINYSRLIGVVCTKVTGE